MNFINVTNITLFNNKKKQKRIGYELQLQLTSLTESIEGMS